MMKRIRIISFLLVCHYHYAISQACSDPGICTIGPLFSASSADTVTGTDFTKAGLDELLNSTFLSEKFSLSAELSYGIGDRKTSIYSCNLRGAIRLRKKMLLGFKLPYVIAQGVLGTSNGLGDLTINFQDIIKSGNSYRMAYTFGVVIPTNNANLKHKGAALPMVYQSSNGFFGALAGITVSTKKWNFATGYQQNFGRNGNEFSTENLILDPAVDGYDTLNRQRLNFGSSRNLQNSGDIMLRVERTLVVKKFVFSAGVLPIYRIANSTIKSKDDKIIEVLNSGGITLNITGGLSYKVNNHWRIVANAGFPVINRKVAPDGLRRSSVFLLRISRNFW